MNCIKCGDEAKKKWGGVWMCLPHYRLSAMRCSAKAKGKTVPSWKELYHLLSKLCCLQCPHCKQQMVWLRSQNSRRVITLQHDRSGNIKFLCLSCNSSHGNLKTDDDFYKTPKLFECRGCKKDKDLKSFYPNNGKPRPKDYLCKECYRASHRRKK